jgi:hypothetical protein
VLVGAAFHWIIALHPRDGFYNFSSMLFAVFYLFAADALAARSLDGSRRWVVRVSGRFLAAVVVLLVAQRSGVAARAGVHDPFLYLWVAYSSALLAGFAIAIRGAWRSGATLRTCYGMSPAILAVLPAMVVANGVSPYLGLKTESSWAMFSNLRTEGGQSNHLLVPVGLQLFDFQRDLVELVEASDRGLQSLADSRFSIPYFEIRRKPWMSVVYRRDGEERRYATVADDPRFPGEIPWVLRKALSFRPVSSSAQQRCVH